ncbi:hypothetical protein PENSPDRAFT_581540 [Peniophora sp. CONT]|nr:hypothetical protein PENSPDRAFT_581540 [Peniophora sp. CONT]
MKERLEDLSKVVQPTSARLALTAQLFAVATNIHATEDLRQKAMMPFLEGLLGKLEQQLPARDKHNKIVAKGDFVRVLTHPDGTSRYAIEGELKNGFLGNAPMQASVAYAWRIAQPAYDDVRKTTCCPAVILSFIGPYFHVSGVALVDIMIVQSFTDLIYLGGDPFAESQVLRVTKIFDVVAAAIKDLKTYYTDIAPSAIPDSSRLMPKPVPDNNLLILEERFLYQGGRPDSRRSLFRGTYDGAPVLVKFCERYNRTAHTLLAEHDPPLAPKLHLVSEVQGGLKMVVMDFIERQDAHYQFEDQYLPPGVRADVSLAITVLRDAGLVFGDLRRPNILVVPRKHEGEGGDFGAMLVDFDWAGKAGEDRYPLLINVSGDIQWANGVGPGEIMEFKHDVDMFDRLDS